MGLQGARINQKGLTRRGFILGGMLAAGSGAAALAGCSPASAGTDNAKGADAGSNATASAYPDPWQGYYAADWQNKVTETIDTDIAIVGAGISGIAAALEATQSGLAVELLESQEQAGGNGAFSDCVFSFGSPQQIAGAEAAGVTVTADQIIRSEIELYDYTIDGELWVDTLNHSPENTQWLLDAGCKTEETTTFYGGNLGKTPTVLMWKDGVGGGSTSATGPMLETLKGLGVEPRCKTRGAALKMDDNGKACGIYAEGPDGVLEINAKAVILAGGGWAASPEMLAEYGGYNMDKTDIFCCAGCVGDTLKMAAAIGARQDAVSRGYMFGNAITGITSSYIMQYHKALWVNGNGRRFANEDCGEVCHDFTGTAVRSQEDVFLVLDDDMIAEMDGDATVTTNAEGKQAQSLREEIDAAAADSANKDVAVANTVEELKALLSEDNTIQDTIDTYQSYCEQGHDDLFGKDPSYLQKLSEGPLYLLRVHQTICISLGGINTNARWQVVDEAKKPIEGLYAIGADGQMVYRGLYNLNTAGGHMAINFDSGRYSVKHAKETYC